jgi:hypothetical protein
MGGLVPAFVSDGWVGLRLSEVTAEDLADLGVPRAARGEVLAALSPCGGDGGIRSDWFLFGHAPEGERRSVPARHHAATGSRIRHRRHVGAASRLRCNKVGRRPGKSNKVVRMMKIYSVADSVGAPANCIARSRSYPTAQRLLNS